MFRTNALKRVRVPELQVTWNFNWSDQCAATAKKSRVEILGLSQSFGAQINEFFAMWDICRPLRIPLSGLAPFFPKDTDRLDNVERLDMSLTEGRIEEPMIF